jgi:hypothetical protein
MKDKGEFRDQGWDFETAQGAFSKEEGGLFRAEF